MATVAERSHKPVLICLFAGWLVELVGNIIIKPNMDSYIAVHSAQSILYAILCLCCFRAYVVSKNNKTLILSLLAFIYGVLLIITIDDDCYAILSGVIWNYDFNFLLVYRCVELCVLLGLIENGKHTDWIRNTIITARSSDCDRFSHNFIKSDI